jgi:hypothetical protein
MARYEVDPHYRLFQAALEKAIAALEKDMPQGLSKRQKRDWFLKQQEAQYNELILLENKFRRLLVKTASGRKVYEAFVTHIRDVRRNVLDARPFFRERQETFSEKISDALRRRRPHWLYPFAINYRFVLFALDVLGTRGPRSPFVVLANKIKAIREKMLVLNLPLSISRAKIFRGKTPQAHLSLMDLVQLAYEGEAAGIDKFVGPYGKMLRGVMIGRITGNLIEAYSDTTVKFWPDDRRKLYRANKLVGRSVGPIDYEVLADGINAQVVDGGSGKKTTPTEIASLMAAASTVSASTPVGNDEDDEATSVADRFAAPPAWQPDVAVERAEAARAVQDAMHRLPLLDQKLLRLSGIDIARFAT